MARFDLTAGQADDRRSVSDMFGTMCKVHLRLVDRIYDNDLFIVTCLQEVLLRILN